MGPIVETKMFIIEFSKTPGNDHSHGWLATGDTIKETRFFYSYEAAVLARQQWLLPRKSNDEAYYQASEIKEIKFEEDLAEEARQKQLLSLFDANFDEFESSLTNEEKRMLKTKILNSDNYN